MKTSSKFLAGGLLVLILFNLPFSSHSQVTTSDSSALVALYDSTEGPNWSNNTNWLSGNVSTWHGVTILGNRVVELDLSDDGTLSFNGNNLNGSLPPEIGDLTALEVLDLGTNCVNCGFGGTNNNLSSGPMPAEIGNLTQLQLLDLGQTGMTGDIPTELQNLTNLIELNLSGQNFDFFQSFPDLSNLTNLTFLSLASCRIGGEIDPSLWTLTNLTSLYLNANSLQGNLSSISNLTSLQDFDCAANSFSGSIPTEIGSLSSLSTLNLGQNQFNGSIPSELLSLSNLSYLYLSGNQLTGEIPSELGTLSSLTELRLSSNQLSGTIPPELGNLSSLFSLNLASNELTGSVPTEFTGLTSLNTLLISNNNLEDLPDLTSLTSIASFSVHNNFFGFDDLISNLTITGFDGSPQNLMDVGFESILAPGDDITFDLSSYGNGTGNTFQWRLDGSDIAGETSQILNLINVDKDSQGTYQLAVTNPSAPGVELLSDEYFISINQTYYWVDDGGNWHDTTHWSLSSGIVDPTGVVPDLHDDVRFDENSFSQSGQVVIIPDLGNATGPNFSTMDWTGVTNNPTFQIRADSSPWIAQNVRGSLIFDNNMTTDFHHAEFYFNSPSDYELDTKGHYMGEDCFVTFGYPLGTGESPYPSTCNIRSEVNNILLFAALGRVNTNGHKFIGQPNHYFWLWGNYGDPIVDVSGSEVDLGHIIIHAGELIDDDATITIRSSQGTRNVQLPTDFNHIIAADTIELGGRSNTYQTLEILPGAGVRLQADSTQTINNLIANGSASKPILIGSTVDTVAAILSKGTGEINVSHTTIENNIATGGATFNAYGSTDGGNVTGWNFLPLQLTSDSLALVGLYDKSDGGNWTDNTNWLSGDIETWFGTTVTGGRITEVQLSDNNLVGSLSSSIDQLEALEILDLSGNEISYVIALLSDFTNITNIDLSENRLDFEDLEPLVSIPELNYDNQKNIMLNQPDTVLVPVGNSQTISVSTGGTANTYRWRYEGSNISGSNATNTSYTVENIDRSNMGKYQVRVQNSNVPDLTLFSDEVSVLATAIVSTEVVDIDGNELEEDVSGSLMETTRRARGYDTLGVKNEVSSSFSFDPIVLNDFLVGVTSDPSKYVDTYYKNVFLWEEADTLKLFGDTTIQISITSIPPVLDEDDGEGIVRGTIEEDFAEEDGRIDARRRAAKRKCGLRKRRRGGRIGQEDDIYDLIAYGETNENGEFEYGFLPEGTYRFFVEYPGIPLDESSFVQFDIGEAGVTDDEFVLAAVVTEDGITVELVLGITSEFFTDFKIYPNPSTDFINIGYDRILSEKMRVDLIDMNGKILMSKEVAKGKNGSLQMDMRSHSQGQYILKFVDLEKNKTALTFRVIKR